MTMHLSNKKSICLLLAAVLAVLIALGGCGGSPGGGAPPATSSGPSTPSAESAERFSFIVCGDPQNNYDVFDKVLEAAKSVDFLIIAGDLTGSGTATEFQSFVDAMNASGVKYYTVPGNHDVATSPVGGNYATYIGKPHSSFDYRHAHFILIDNSTPELGFYPSERAWARKDLKAARRKGFEHIIAVAHVPPGYPYSASATEDQITGLDANHELIPLLSEGGVKNLFCGHVHTYMEERDDGVTVTITGGAGAPLHYIGGESYHHYVLVEVNGERLTVKPVRI
jgi:1,2-diacylglycerol 3-alpha-glucosyltransferase